MQRAVKRTKRSSIARIFRPRSLENDLDQTTDHLFGRKLQFLCNEKNPIPTQVQVLCAMLKQQADSTLGIFRRSANQRQLRLVRSELDSGVPASICLSGHPPILLAAILKEFLRNLPDALMCSALCADWIAVLEIATPEAQIQNLSTLLNRLPPENLSLLRVVLDLLYHVALNSKQNMMTATNLGVCVGQCLLWPCGQFDSTQASQVSRITELLIEMCPLLLPISRDNSMSMPQHFFIPSLEQRMDAHRMALTPMSPLSSKHSQSQDELSDGRHSSNVPSPPRPCSAEPVGVRPVNSGPTCEPSSVQSLPLSGRATSLDSKLNDELISDIPLPTGAKNEFSIINNELSKTTKPSRPPPYREAMERLSMLALSQPELERQRSRGELARRLYAESSRAYEKNRANAPLKPISTRSAQRNDLAQGRKSESPLIGLDSSQGCSPNSSFTSPEKKIIPTTGNRSFESAVDSQRLSGMRSRILPSAKNRSFESATGNRGFDGTIGNRSFENSFGNRDYNGSQINGNLKNHRGKATEAGESDRVKHSLKNQKWHRDMAQRYNQTFYQPRDIPSLQLYRPNETESYV